MTFFEVGDEVTFPALPDMPDCRIRTIFDYGGANKVELESLHNGRILIRPANLIRDFAQLIEPEPEDEHPTPDPRSNLLWVGVDLDGTLAQPVWTPDNPTHEIGPPIEHNVRKYRELIAAGFKGVIHTSRAWTDYETIEMWLNHYNIPFKAIQCGKPLYALYVDDRGRHSEAESWLPEAAQSGVPKEESA